MRRISVLLALSLLVASAAHPCSAKFAGRQTALQARPALRPASILILSNESLRVHVRPLTSTLERLGHKVTEVESPDEILNVLSSGKKYDIVLASVADLGSLAERFDTSSAGVVAVPLIRRVSAEDVTSPEGYPIALDLAAKSTMIREMIERAMEQKEEGAKAKQSREDA